jgi:hypothetical protein
MINLSSLLLNNSIPKSKSKHSSSNSNRCVRVPSLSRPRKHHQKTLNNFTMTNNNNHNNNTKYRTHTLNLANMPSINNLLSRKRKTPSVKREEPDPDPVLNCDFKYKDLNTKKTTKFSKKLTKSQLDRLKSQLQYKKNTHMEYDCRSEDGTHQESFQTSNFMSSSSSSSSPPKKTKLRSLPKTKTVFVRSKKVKSKPVKKKVSSVKKKVSKPVKKKVSSVKKPVVKPVKRKVSSVKKPVSKPVKKKVSSVKKPVAKPVKKKVSSVKKPVAKPVKKKVVPKKKSTKRKSKQPSKVLSRKDLNNLGAELLGEN